MDTAVTFVSNEYFSYLELLEHLSLLENLTYLPLIFQALQLIVTFICIYSIIVLCFLIYKFFNIFF